MNFKEALQALKKGKIIKRQYREAICVGSKSDTLFEAKYNQTFKKFIKQKNAARLKIKDFEAEDWEVVE